MSRFQFTVRNVFLATTLIGIGIVAIIWGLRGPSHHDFPLDLAAFFDVFFHFGAIIGGAGIIGAGLGTPLNRKWDGMLLGFIVLILIAFGWTIIQKLS